MNSVYQRTIGRFSRGISPQAYGLAFFDWASHLAANPSKQLELLTKVPGKSLGPVLRSVVSNKAPESKDVERKDPRFASPGWERLPYRVIHQVYSFQENWINEATTGVPGVEKHHEEIVNSTFKQLLSAASPATLPWMNPDVLQETVKTRGQNLVQGFKNLKEDWTRKANGEGIAGAERFKVGEKVAVTPGKVLFRNQLIELIQYAPATAEVHAEPILIVPAWIMKYYILDLSPRNSLIKYLVEQGHTVFTISWKNPGKAESELSMQDYLDLGVMSALDAIQTVVPDKKIHALGYCLGGTLLSIAASAMARDGDDRLKSVTMLAAQTDFTEAGEIRNFIDESQISALEADMNQRGYLEGLQMGAAFSSLRPYDLIWSRILREYFLGQRQELIDIMAWNADTTRLPARMHSEYLRKMYLNNDLAQGRFMVRERPIAVHDLRIPLFVVGTETDHVAPWKSVFKIHLLTSTDLTFLLTNGGHNAGIVSEPGRPRRHYRVAKRAVGDSYKAPADWFSSAKQNEGSWWPEWSAWLASNSSGKTAPPSMGNAKKGLSPIGDAPGEYVFEK